MASPVVSAEAIGKRFDGKPAIEGLSFEVHDGEFVTIVGPSGCGKSTTLRIVSGLEPPTSGTVRAHGAQVTKPIQNAAMVFQSPVLLPWRRTVENILLSAEADGNFKFYFSLGGFFRTRPMRSISQPTDPVMC